MRWRRGGKLAADAFSFGILVLFEMAKSKANKVCLLVTVRHLLVNSYMCSIPSCCDCICRPRRPRPRPSGDDGGAAKN